MKNTLLLGTAVLLLFSCNIKTDKQVLSNLVTKTATGPQTTREYTMNFSGLHVSQGIDAEVFKSTENKIIISAPADIIDDVLAEKSGSSVQIRFRPGLNISAHNVNAKVYTKSLSTIEASSSGRIRVKDKFTQDQTDISASSSGQIFGDFEANQLSVRTSSSGSYQGQIWAVNLEAVASSAGAVTLIGKTGSAMMKASSSGSIDAAKVFAKSADLSASSAGDISLTVSNRVSARASSGGDIHVNKNGALTKADVKESSGGSISIK